MKRELPPKTGSAIADMESHLAALRKHTAYYVERRVVVGGCFAALACALAIGFQDGTAHGFLLVTIGGIFFLIVGFLATAILDLADAALRRSARDRETDG